MIEQTTDLINIAISRECINLTHTNLGFAFLPVIKELITVVSINQRKKHQF